SVSFNGTYLMKWDQKSIGQPTQQLAGRYGGGVAATVIGSGATGGFPHWKHNATITHDIAAWQLSLNQLFVGSYQDADESRDVGTYSVIGFNAAYSGFRNFTLSAGVKNLLDRDPPYTRQNNAF